MFLLKQEHTSKHSISAYPVLPPLDLFANSQLHVHVYINEGKLKAYWSSCRLRSQALRIRENKPIKI